ncbi:phage holin family protein [Brevibacillus laterosporus]|uniref:Holin n=1 Tax=Brevibacillus laterosporus TaxID=1465 RepID=A0A0F7EF62_BRELA|nr:holin [Brevibacillus laterosporus]
MNFSLELNAMAKPATIVIGGIGSLVLPWIDFLYVSGHHHLLIALFLIIATDWVTGISASIKDGTYSSEYGIGGVFRTIFILFFPVLANVLDHALQTPGFLFFGVTFGLIYHTWASVTANAIRAGWEKWIPKKVMNLVGSELEAKAERAQKLRRGNDGDDY